MNDIFENETALHGGGHSLKLSSAHLILIGDWVQDKNDITLKEIQSRLEGQEKIKVSLATICRVFKSLNLTRKKTLHASERETERVQKLRVEYRETVRNIPAEEMIFVDEAGSNLGMTLLYARSEKGRRAYGEGTHSSSVAEYDSGAGYLDE